MQCYIQNTAMYSLCMQRNFEVTSTKVASVKILDTTLMLKGKNTLQI